MLHVVMGLILVPRLRVKTYVCLFGLGNNNASCRHLLGGVVMELKSLWSSLDEVLGLFLGSCCIFDLLCKKALLLPYELLDFSEEEA